MDKSVELRCWLEQTPTREFCRLGSWPFGDQNDYFTCLLSVNGKLSSLPDIRALINLSLQIKQLWLNLKRIQMK